MRVIPTGFAAHIALDSTTTAVCWLIEKLDGTFIRGTEHDQDITVPSQSPDDLGLSGFKYLALAGITGSDLKSSSDMSVDNMEVSGAVPSDMTVDVTVDEINAGILNGAPVTVFCLNWADPAQGYYILGRGNLGQITHNSDGGYTTEIRLLAQYLTQNTCQTYNENCNVIKFGDARCKFDALLTQLSGTVSGITSRRIFAVDMPMGSPSPPWSYSGGLITFTSGANATFEREVKLEPQAQVNGFMELWDNLPEDLTVGDTFTIIAGCDRLLATCVNVFQNPLNFRGYGVYIPGVMALTQGPV